MKHITILFTLIVLFTSCKKKAETSDKTIKESFTSGFMAIACDENFKRLMDTSIDVFEAINHYEAIVTPIYTNETEAIRLFVEDSVRFVLATRDLYPREYNAVKKHNLQARSFVIGFDGLAIVSHQSNPDSLMTVSTLRKILSGEITEWKQINPNSPLGTINIILDNKESGVLRYAIDSICHGQVLTSPNLYALDNYQVALDQMKDLPSSILLMGANFFTDENNPQADQYNQYLRLMRISEAETATLENSYLPYAGDIHREDYPFWRSIYVIISDPRSGLPSGFTNFFAQQRGQKIIQHSGLMPVTDTYNQDVRIIDAYPE